MANCPDFISTKGEYGASTGQIELTGANFGKSYGKFVLTGTTENAQCLFHNNGWKEIGETDCAITLGWLPLNEIKKISYDLIITPGVNSFNYKLSYKPLHPKDPQYNIEVKIMECEYKFGSTDGVYHSYNLVNPTSN